MRLWRHLNNYKSNDFVKAVGVLIGGTALAQILMMALLPVLTRLYTPDDFSVLSIYLALLSVISVAATLRFELAISIPEDELEARNLLYLSVLFSLVTASIFAGLILFFSADISSLFGRSNLHSYLWVLPIGIFFSGSYSALQFWAGRKRRFSIIAKTRVQQAVGAASVQMLFGVLSGGPLGLILGQTINNGAGVLGLARNIYCVDKSLLTRVHPRQMFELIIKYSRFPKYSMLEGLANNAAIQVPVIVIASLSVGPEAGYLLLAMQLMQAPVSLVGGAVSQVYLSKAPEMYRVGKLSDFTSETLLGLIKVGIIPLAIAGAAAPLLFPFIFGEQWSRTGVIVLYMVPWIGMQLLASPISMALHVTNNQPIAMGLQFSGLLLRVGAVAVSASWFPNTLTEVYAVTGFIFYACYLLIVMKVTGVNSRKLLSRVKLIIGIALVILLFGFSYIALQRLI